LLFGLARVQERALFVGEADDDFSLPRLDHFAYAELGVRDELPLRVSLARRIIMERPGGLSLRSGFARSRGCRARPFNLRLWVAIEMIAVAGATDDALDAPTAVQGYDLMRAFLFATPAVCHNLVAQTHAPDDAACCH
jgi:hypothetical protein